jgi:predicted acylesterase/phospholipase RssA
MRPTADGGWTKIIPFSQAQRMTDDEIIACFHFNHFPIPHSQGGPDCAWNLDPMPVAEHQEVTAKKDIPQIAKTKRLAREHEEFRQRMLTPRDERPAKRSKWASRPFPKRRKPC